MRDTHTACPVGRNNIRPCGTKSQAPASGGSVARTKRGAGESLASQDQQPLLGIALYEQAMAGTTPLYRRAHLLAEAIALFER